MTTMWKGRVDYSLDGERKLVESPVKFSKKMAQYAIDRLVRAIRLQGGRVHLTELLIAKEEIS